MFLNKNCSVVCFNKRNIIVAEIGTVVVLFILKFIRFIRCFQIHLIHQELAVQNRIYTSQFSPIKLEQIVNMQPL